MLGWLADIEKVDVGERGLSKGGLHGRAHSIDIDATRPG